MRQVLHLYEEMRKLERRQVVSMRVVKAVFFMTLFAFVLGVAVTVAEAQVNATSRSTSDLTKGNGTQSGYFIISKDNNQTVAKFTGTVKTILSPEGIMPAMPAKCTEGEAARNRAETRRSTS